MLQNFIVLGFMLKRSEYLTNIFHLFIIASFILSVSGCGYKAPPYHEQKAPKGDENVKFIVKQPTTNSEDR